MSENSTLRIHTQMTPVAEGQAKPNAVKRRRSFAVHRARATTGKAHMTAGDRLLRNSAIACAALLAVLALGNVRQPWAKKAVESIESALSMRINLDDSLGQLTFVRQLMPESTLVFLNVSGSPALASPVAGAVSHPWSALQPWVMFDTSDAPVQAVEAGTVTAVSSLSGGEYGLLIDHGNGLESVYAGLAEATVRPGDTVTRGQALGMSGKGLYYELRNGGESIDPTERLGLQ